MTRFVTLNQFVNLWECDENDHMNVQFYYSKFEDSALLFALCNGLDHQLGPLKSRHVRYHSELRGGAQIQVRSSLVLAESAQQISSEGCYIQHVMRETTTGRIAATSLDWHEGNLPSADSVLFDQIDEAVLPRGVKFPANFAPKTPRSDEEAVIARGVLHPGLCNDRSEARNQAYIGAVSDAASHAWERVGLGIEWLEEMGFGRVAVEMRLCVISPMTVGTPYQLQLGFTGLHSRAFNKRYDFFDLRDNRHIAFMDSAVMLLNHTTRKSEPLPNFAREAIEARLG